MSNDSRQKAPGTQSSKSCRASRPAALFFHALEWVGVPIVALVLAGLIVIGRRTKSLPETLIGFGFTYSIEVIRVATSDYVLALQRQDPGSVAYFATHLAVAAAIVLCGCGLLLARPSPAIPQRGGGNIASEVEAG